MVLLMDIKQDMKDMNNLIVNPLLKNKLEVTIDEKSIPLTIANISKYFYKLYILTPFKNESITSDIFNRQINKDLWYSFKSKLVLSETSIKIVKNFEHSHNVSIVNTNDIEMFNHFGYDLPEKILVLPMFNISYLNIQNYLKIYEGHYKLEDIYNIIVINELFSKKSRISFNSLIYMTEIIKNLEETDYWTRKYNCLLNITKQFNFRKFRLTNTKIIKNPEIEKVIKELDQDTVENNYLTMIFSNKNFVDASSAIKKNGYKLYKISKKSEMTKTDIDCLFSKLNLAQKFHLFSNLLVSKKYCHLVLNNDNILKTMSKTIDCFSDMYRYLFGYAWLRFYMEESIKKTWINKDDEFIFDINTASLLPVFPFTLDDIKANPYVPLMVDDNSIQGNNNFGGFTFLNTTDADYKNQGITDLDGFQRRFNLFISGNSSNNIFNNLNWEKVGMGVSGSIMAACLQKRHPLLTLFKGKNNFNNLSDFDLDYNRFFNEYYAEADVDVMIKSSEPLDFIKKSKMIFNQVVVNICGFNPSNAEPNHVKMRTIRTVFLFVTEEFIKNNIETESLKYEFIISNLKDDKIIQLFKPYFKNKIDDFYKELFEEYSKNELETIKNQHPEIFEDNETVYQIHLSKEKKSVVDVKIPVEITEEELDKILEENEDNFEEDFKNFKEQNFDDIGINISFKVKISSSHIQRQLELFSIFGDDFFSLVSKFHVPCVRAYYDGTNVYMTPSCISAHMTYMNLDYKYFAGSKDPIEIILKYRMRGFGTFLNKKELDKTIKYIKNVTFWNNLYSIDLNNKETIKSSLGSLSFQHKLYHPRLFNVELFGYSVPYVNINDGYNNPSELEKLNSGNITQYMKNNFTSLENSINMLNYRTIGKDGYVQPVQKWIIDACFNLNKSSYYYNMTGKDDNNETNDQSNDNVKKIIEIIDDSSSSNDWNYQSVNQDVVEESMVDE